MMKMMKIFYGWWGDLCVWSTFKQRLTFGMTFALPWLFSQPVALILHCQISSSIHCGCQRCASKNICIANSLRVEFKLNESGHMSIVNCCAHFYTTLKSNDAVYEGGGWWRKQDFYPSHNRRQSLIVTL